MGYYTEKALKVKAENEEKLKKSEDEINELLNIIGVDPEDGKTYLCKRLDETGTISLHYLLHEPVGNYFEET